MLTSFVLWSISGIQHISRSGGKREEFWEPSIQWGWTGTYCCSHCSHEWACQSMTSTGTKGLLHVVCSYVKYFYVFSSRLDILFIFELFLFHPDFWVNCPLNIDWNCELNHLKAFLAHCFFLSLSLLLSLTFRRVLKTRCMLLSWALWPSQLMVQPPSKQMPHQSTLSLTRLAKVTITTWCMLYCPGNDLALFGCVIGSDLWESSNHLDKEGRKQLWTISSFIHLDLVYPTTPAKALTRQQIYIRDVAVHKNDTYLCLN